jgi:hypothetical protein
MEQIDDTLEVGKPAWGWKYVDPFQLVLDNDIPLSRRSPIHRFAMFDSVWVVNSTVSDQKETNVGPVNRTNSGTF